MAKKQTKDKDEEKEGKVELVPQGLSHAELMDYLNKKWGGAFKNAAKNPIPKRQIIPVSPAIDLALGGGISEGTWTVIVGWEKDGKTALCLQFARQATKRKKYVKYFNLEGRLKERDEDGYNGLDKNYFERVESNEEKFYTAQDYLEMAMDAMVGSRNAVFIFDSFSRLLDKDLLGAKIGTSTRGGIPKLLSDFCTRMASVVPVHNHIVLGITQYMANTGNTGGYNGPIEKGGNALKYQTDIKLKAKKSEDWKVSDNVIGNITTWQTEVTATNKARGMVVQSYHRFGYGFDEAAELASIGETLALLKKGNAGWYELSFLESHGEEPAKAQGMENVCRKLKENPEWLTWLEQDVKSLVLA